MPRDSAGVYTLPAGNPVVSGTIIESTWANNTMNDVAASLTDSLSRTGNGGMQAPLRGLSGTAGSPSYSFTNAPTSGMYHDDATSQVGFSVNAVKEFAVATGAVVLPDGTTAERPSPAEQGMFRFNTDTGDFEGYDGVDWKVVTVSNALNRIEEFVTDPTKDTFTIAYLASVGADVWINGIKLNHDSYDDSSGSEVILNEPAVQGEYVEIIGYSEFEVADVYTKPEVDALLDGYYTKPETDTLLAEKANANLIMNPCGSVNQRLSTSRTTSGYLTDRWKFEPGLTGVGSVTMGVTGASVISEVSTNHMYVLTGNPQASLGADEYVFFQEVIEGYDAAALMWGTPNAKPATLSFTTQSVGITGDIHVAIRSSTADYSYVAPISVTAGQIEKHTITIPPVTDGTFPKDNQKGFHLAFTYALSQAGTFTAPSVEQWLAGNYLGGPTQVNGMASNGDSIAFTDIKLEVGEVATPLVLPHFAEELALCQRYYQTISDLLVGGVTQVNSGTVYVDHPMPVTMRDNPMGVVAGTVTYVGASDYTMNIAASTKFRISIVITTAQTYGYGYGALLTFDADF